jgi:hypothetical protein
MAIDHSNMRLGKRPRRHDSRTLKLARYLTSTLPPAPSRVDYTRGVTDWGMMLNDQLGCCTIAAAAHAVQAWTVNSGQEITIPDSAVLGAYEKWCGYNPADAATDQGGIELDVLNNWRQQAFDGHGLDAYVAVDLEDRNSKLDTRNSAVLPRVSNDDFRISAVATAIWLFGGAYIGVELPLTARNQDVWDVPANPGPDDEPGSWGGHAVYLVAYDFRNSGLGPRVSGFGKEDSESPIPNSGPRTPSPEFRIPNPGTRTPSPESRTPNSDLHHLGSTQEDDLGVVSRILLGSLRAGLQGLAVRNRRSALGIRLGDVGARPKSCHLSLVIGHLSLVIGL